MSRIACAALVAALIAAPALAQTAAGQSFVLGGSAVPGLCFLSEAAVVQTSKVGVAALTRQRELIQQVQAQVDAEKPPLAAEAKAIDAQSTSLPTAQLQQRREALVARAKALQDEAATRTRQLALTWQHALGQIGANERPVLAQVYAAHGCGLLLDRGSVLNGNMSGDLTAEVVRGLDARVTTITFDLEPPPPAQAARPAQ